MIGGASARLARELGMCACVIVLLPLSGPPPPAPAPWLVPPISSAGRSLGTAALHRRHCVCPAERKRVFLKAAWECPCHISYGCGHMHMTQENRS